MDKNAEFISSYVSGLSYAGLPHTAVQAVKERTVDTMGAVMAAYLLAAGKAVRTLCSSMGSPIEKHATARIIGSLKPTTPEMAAFANTTMARDLDLNDVHRVNAQAAGHPSDVILSLLALAESAHADGKTLITAITAAYEMCVPFVERSTIPTHFEAIGMMDTLGVAMGSGIILGLTKEQLANAAALAVLPNVGLGMRRVGQASMYKEAYAGMAGRQGIFAARMAQAGMDAPAETFEGAAGFVKVVMGGKPIQWEPLGGKTRQFLVERTILKQFPVGGTIQLPVRTALALRKRVRADAIESIHVRIDAGTYSTSAKPEHWTPKTRETADHSVPVCMAMAFVDGALTPETWLRRRFEAEDVLGIASKTTVEEVPEFTNDFPAHKHCHVIAKTRDGQLVEVHHIETPDEQKLTTKQVEAKFYDLSHHVLAPAQIRAFMDTVWRLEQLDDVARILDHLAV